MLSFCLMPQMHFFQDVSHALLQNKFRVFVERKKRLRRWFHCVWSMRLCVAWILFSLLNIVSNCHFWFVSLCTGRVCYFQVQFWIMLGSTKPFWTKKNDCEAQRVFLAYCPWEIYFLCFWVAFLLQNREKFFRKGLLEQKTIWVVCC